MPIILAIIKEKKSCRYKQTFISSERVSQNPNTLS